MNSAPPTSLYDRDILLWVEDTVAKLKAKDFEHLDLENLIEEVESLGISQRKELLSRLTVILEHLLKRLYVNSPYDYNGWERTVRTQRTELRVLFRFAPSLKGQWAENFTEAWVYALKTVRQDYPDTPFPDEWPFEADLEAMLDRPFWQTPP
ncbi:DUF29 domain-containing protein [Prochlorothrix hollandica]|uniref:DUF29 domain-containing protein n=1 Tax=Prochlorothrix hollandica PCC 9006 = CALU 1027 TaxID=317619 RepID=A0A0M2Q026_PROHO|nr:DUF29 domain-containing protein [Prochlorothrix hollandica]KKJ00668.1 hypothetical protein PROH_05065 [Prochlorothrix hollandica PCC 9006 = CALU 1027]